MTSIRRCVVRLYGKQVGCKMEKDSILYELILPQASIPDEIPHMEYQTPIIEGAPKRPMLKESLHGVIWNKKFY